MRVRSVQREKNPIRMAALEEVRAAARKTVGAARQQT